MVMSCQSNDSRGYIVKVGDTAPDFSVKMSDGSTIKLSELRGKVVMLQFTASWCSVCRKEMPFIEKEIWQKHKNNKDFALYALARKDTEAKVKSMVDLTGITYPITLDVDDIVFQKYAEKRAGVTRNIIIDKDGKIVFLTRLFERKEFDEMKEVINKLLK